MMLAMTQWTSTQIVAENAISPLILFAMMGEEELIGPPDHRARAAAAIRSSGFEPAGGRWLDLVGEAGAARLLIIGSGTPPGSEGRWLAAGGYVVDALRALRLKAARVPASGEFDEPGSFETMLTGAVLHGYRLAQGRRDGHSKFTPERLVVDEVDLAIAERALRHAGPINRARAWVEQPANLLTPSVFADEAASALSACGVQVRVLGPAELEELGAGALLAVGRGSEHAPRLVVAEWRGDPDRAGWDVAMVGKGLTFDAGGLNLKVRPVIEKMKFDMGGAAAVLGAMEAAALRRARVNVVAVVPMAENMIDSRGARPGDVVRSLSGLTVEIINTDAEGRLVLADGITYAIQHYAPRQIVDIATLTGMMAGVLHEEFAGLYASDDGLAAALLAAGERACEPVWRMPLAPAQDYLVDSAAADVANFGAVGFLGLGGGSPAAGAKFLEKFARGQKWAHIDMAGPAWATRQTPRSGPGATGFGVALLDKWLAGLEVPQEA